MRVNIAIDGPSGVGKSALAKFLAQKLNYVFVNTGSFYRGLAYYFLYHQWTKDKALSEIKEIAFDYHNDDFFFINDLSVGPHLRDPEVTHLASNLVAKEAAFRELINKYLTNLVNTTKGLILEGRDTTFVIAPQAEVRVFLTASAHKRAQRRHQQNLEAGLRSDFKSVLKSVELRDYEDTHRKIDPLQIVEGVTVINNDSISLEETAQRILDLITNVPKI